MGGSMPTGGIIEKEAPLPALGAAVRLREVQGADALRRARTSDGAVHRVCVRCGEPARDSVKG